ncbi:hypothetical protein G0Q06_11775 [Puniceicoccales bacterium CK1056]|uniref:Toprim domain-containing protein n=1 Tax=Oceanipulchritudo coccoides TaxID=2706888 RepID=A0A6B2M306_9BACT|nr:hypothetical protein [Oceanipulchritudo coccoides]NDV63133.1 hypothetical protein [Oceanipulchritudo coccoides]
MALTEECKSFKERHGLLEVADRLGVSLKREGRSYRIRKDNSVIFFQKGNQWRWEDKARPDVGGDQIDFIQWHEALDDTTAALRRGHELFGEPFTYNPQCKAKKKLKPFSREDWCRRIAQSRKLPRPDLLEKFPLLQVPQFKHNPDPNYWGIGPPDSGAEQYRRVDGKLFKDGPKAKRLVGVKNRPIGISNINPASERIHLVEGEGDALAVWTLLDDRFNLDLSIQSIVVFCGADVRLRPKEVEKLIELPITIWAQDDLPGLELAVDSYQKLVDAGCDVVVMLPSTVGADWGDYYIKRRFLPLEYDKKWVDVFGWDNLIRWARIRNEHKEIQEEEAKLKHRANGRKGGRPSGPKRLIVESLFRRAPTLQAGELCRRVGMEPNASNKRNVQRWIKALSGATKPTIEKGEIKGCDKTPTKPSEEAHRLSLEAVGY